MSAAGLAHRSSTAAMTRLFPFLAVLAVLAAAFRETGADMVHIWIRSETFTHAFLVPPIVLWLVWRLRDVLAVLPTRPVPWLLVPMAATCFLWLLGELATVAAASQFALVTLIVLAVPALFGWAVARALTFPLLFLYFAVPFGEFTVPQLMDWTADFTVLALRASGIPVFREGLQFVIPTGTWSVVEACSGVRYLIASFMVGTLFAYLNYRSAKRRVIFMAVSLLVPIVANWLRAYMIVMIGHLSGNELAVGVDHLIYGWVFFGVVIGAMFLVGARWSEPDAQDPAPQGLAAEPARHRPGWGVAAGILGLLVGTQVWAWQLDHPDAGIAPSLSLPDGAAGWQAERAAELPWPPGYPNPNATAVAAYRSGDSEVWTWVAYYRQQGPDRKLVSSVNGLVAAGDKRWAVAASGGRAVTEALPAFRTGTVRRGSELADMGSQRVRVWQLYWVGGRWTSSHARAKVWQGLDRLLGRGDDGAVLLLATPLQPDADATLETFARLHLDAIATALARARDTR
jgi:exosortase A